EIVTRTTLKCIGVSPTVANLVEATTVRVVAGAAGGVCPAAGTVSAAQTRRLPIIVDRIRLSLNELVLSRNGIERSVPPPRFSLRRYASRPDLGAGRRVSAFAPFVRLARQWPGRYPSYPEAHQADRDGEHSHGIGERSSVPQAIEPLVELVRIDGELSAHE